MRPATRPAGEGDIERLLLVERAATWAREHGYPAHTLTTFTGVAWNGP